MILFLLFLSTGILAQNNLYTISGKVTDIDNDPLIGANVIVKGNQTGTITNAIGRFELKGVKTDDILLVSYIGMEQKAIPVNGMKQINVVLIEKSQILDEVVAIGYGTMKKSDLTGSVKSVTSSTFSEQTMQTAEQALKGRIAGVRIINDNSPGGGISMQIRGTNSMLGGTEPLYVVDGFPLEPNEDAQGANNTAPQQSSLNFINPDDVASIEVLKDASATAIYGARGANGVVLITTKSGKSGKAQVTYTGKSGISQVSKRIDVLNEEEFANYLNQKEINRYYIQSQAVELGILSAGNLLPIQLPYDGLNKPFPWELNGTGNDWQNTVYKDAFSTNHTIQIQGGNENTKISLSGGYTHQEGVIINTDFKRYTLNGMLEQKINNNLLIRNRFNFSRNESSGGVVSTNDIFTNRGVVSNALWFQPVYSLITEPDEDEDYLDLNYGMTLNNPYLLATLISDDKIGYSVQNILTSELKVNRNLTALMNFALSKNTNKRSQYFPISSKRGMPANGEATTASNERFKYMLEGRINYQKRFKRDHFISSMAAISFEETGFESYFQKYTGFPSDDLTYYSLSGATTIYTPETDYWSSNMLSYIFRGNYKYKERYLLTVTFRADGTSRGAKNVKFGYFPSVAAAWRITEENFMPKTEWLNNLKLRLSYGATGNHPNVPYQSLSILSTIKYPFNGMLQSGAYEETIGNQNLSWEKTDQFNAGVDFTLFNSKLNLTIDLYYKLTDNLLQMLKLPPSSGYTERLMNLGKVENKGVEFDLALPVLNKKDLMLSVSLNGGVNRNKLMDLGNRDYITGRTIGGIIPNRFIVGQPLGVFYGLNKTGVFSDWDQILNSPEGIAQRDATPGEYIFENLYVDYKKDNDGNFLFDESGNKIPEEKQSITVDDYTVIGDPNPDFTFGFGSEFRYKNIDLSVLFSGQIGGEVYWVDYGIMTNMWRNFNMYAPAVENAWVAPYEYIQVDENGVEHRFGNPNGNVNADFPRAINWEKEGATVYSGANSRISRYRTEQMNSSMILDATHLRLQNLSVGYTIKNLMKIQEIRLSLSGTNLITISNYPGYDPEIVSSSSPMMRGIDLGSYPAQKSYSFNVQIKF